MRGRAAQGEGTVENAGGRERRRASEGGTARIARRSPNCCWRALSARNSRALDSSCSDATLVTSRTLPLKSLRLLSPPSAQCTHKRAGV